MFYFEKAFITLDGYSVTLPDLFYFLVYHANLATVKNIGIAVSGIVLTPLNNLLFNMDEENIAQFGIDPRWTHLVINMPMLYGPLLGLVIRSSVRTE